MPSKQEERAEILAYRLSQNTNIDFSLLLQLITSDVYTFKRGRLIEVQSYTREGIAFSYWSPGGFYSNHTFSAQTEFGDILRQIPRDLPSSRSPSFRSFSKSSNIENLYDPRITSGEIDNFLVGFKEGASDLKSWSTLRILTESRTLCNNRGDVLTDIGTWWTISHVISISQDSQIYHGSDFVNGRVLPASANVISLFKERASALAIAQTTQLQNLDQNPSVIVLSERAVSQIFSYLFTMKYNFPDYETFPLIASGSLKEGLASTSFDDYGNASREVSLENLSSNPEGFYTRQGKSKPFYRDYRASPSLGHLNLLIPTGNSSMSEIMQECPPNSIYVESFLDLDLIKGNKIRGVTSTSYLVIGESVGNTLQSTSISFDIDKLWSVDSMRTKTRKANQGSQTFSACYAPTISFYI